MATHSSILACNSPWTEEPGRLQSVGSQRVGHDYFQDSYLENSRDRGAWQTESSDSMESQRAGHD